MDVNDPDQVDCSSEFYLMASEEVPEAGEVEGPYLFVTSPSTGDFALGGEVYTVEVRERKEEKQKKNRRKKRLGEELFFFFLFSVEE